jgi:hypothetical protein
MSGTLTMSEKERVALTILQQHLIRMCQLSLSIVPGKKNAPRETGRFAQQGDYLSSVILRESTAPFHWS